MHAAGQPRLLDACQNAGMGAAAPRRQNDMVDTAAFSLCLHNQLGSLGPTLVGHDQFAGYVDFVTETFGQYTTDILAMIEEGNRVAGKMRFHGFHRKELFGVPPSGRHVWWTGMPIFTFEGTKVRDLFVLGDIHGLISRLKD